ncbi:PHD finger-like domain-containing protein 5A-like protein [Linderina pennispora]|uniref:PHD finger-like domain-containing protein 5A-like protein n=1 Tax=Linderina pennispora TaxID=61395 RepID=A0A1Y1WJ88_9FUNG|nr:PHD finger-like domain-containing protein 5A-like protein [Linderina pennispora]ORX73542.1 PHD finger-like domain-containing protein 5A-like protein [Linderina pennispora]
MARHHPDLLYCRRMPGIAIGTALVHICDECNYGTYKGRCIVCDGRGISDAYYCKECVTLEKDRDGCPKIVNLGTARTDLFYERKKYGFQKR